MADQLSSDLASLKIARDAPPAPSSGRKVLVFLVIAALLAAVGVVVVRKLGPRVFKQPVTVTEVSLLSPVQESVQVTSTGYVIPQVWSKVGAKIPGRLSRVLVKEGDVVKTGDLLAVLDDADQKSAVTAAAARVSVARARGEAARANLAEVSRQVERTRGLFQDNAAPRAQLEDLESRAKSLSETVKAANAEVSAIEAEVQTLRVGLKDRVIVAPIDGTVIAKPAAVGETVGFSATGAAHIVEIADFDSIVVETDVPEARLHLIKPGTPCEIVLDAYPQRRYRGTTTEIGKRINRAKATVTAKVKFTDTLEGVLPDMSARVSFLREEIKAESLQEKPKTIVAADAIVDRNGRKVVFAVDDGKLRMVYVRTGPAMGSSVELLDGPRPGTRVVKQPTDEMYEGQRIKETEN